VADRENNCIRKVSIDGFVTTVSTGRNSLDDETIRFDCLHGLTIDNFGNIIVADTKNSRICTVDHNGIVKTLIDGLQNKLFYWPQDVVLDKFGNIIVANTGSHKISLIDGNGDVIDLIDKLFCWPRAVAVDHDGNIIVADTSNNRICKITIFTNDHWPGSHKYLPPALKNILLEFFVITRQFENAPVATDVFILLANWIIKLSSKKND